MYNTEFVQKLAFAYRNLSLRQRNISKHTSTVSCDLVLEIFLNINFCALFMSLFQIVDLNLYRKTRQSQTADSAPVLPHNLTAKSSPVCP